MLDELKLHEKIAQKNSQQEWTKGIFNLFYQIYVRKAREFLRERRPDLILDVGCGEGYIFKDYHQQYQIVQIDASPTVLGVASSFNRKLVCGNAMELPFKEKAFDLIFLVAILEHVSNPLGLIKEVYRVAKEKANVFILIPNDISLSLGRLLLLKEACSR